MSFVRTFSDYVPIARTDVPWTLARIDEAPDVSGAPGAWTPLETITLSPVDSNPLSPQERTLTTNQATLARGWYRVVFIDAAGNSESTAAIYYPSAVAPFVPSLDDVASLLRARTRDDDDREGAFTATTRPTADEVEDIIATAASRVGVRVGANIDERFWSPARTLTALYAAMLIEASYWPEQANADDSSYARLKALYDEQILELVDGLQDVGESTSHRLGTIGVRSPTKSAYLDSFADPTFGWLPT